MKKSNLILLVSLFTFNVPSFADNEPFVTSEEIEAILNELETNPDIKARAIYMIGKDYARGESINGYQCYEEHLPKGKYDEAENYGVIDKHYANVYGYKMWLELGYLKIEYTDESNYHYSLTDKGRNKIEHAIKQYGAKLDYSKSNYFPLCYKFPSYTMEPVEFDITQRTGKNTYDAVMVIDWAIKPEDDYLRKYYKDNYGKEELHYPIKLRLSYTDNSWKLDFLGFSDYSDDNVDLGLKPLLSK